MDQLDIKYDTLELESEIYKFGCSIYFAHLRMISKTILHHKV